MNDATPSPFPPRCPKPLAAGDLIAITAPSSGVQPSRHARLDRALDALRQLGYRVVEGDCLRAEQQQASAPAAQRAAELMRFLCDPAVAAVMPPWGGERAIELLPLLDFEALAALPPKWLVGFSDLSTLQLPLLLRAGWSSLHGPNLMEHGAAEVDTTTAAVWKLLAAAPGEAVQQPASSAYRGAGQQVDWGVDPAAGFILSEPTRWARLDGMAAPLTLEGRLVGGCLDTIARLAGTPYGELPAFVRACGSEGTLLFLENCEMAPCELLRCLSSLRLHGWFEGLAGLLIGRSAGPAQQGDLGTRQVLLDVLGDLPLPVLVDLDIGHVPPQLSLLQGGLARVHFDGAGGGWVAQRKPGASAA